MSLQKLEERYQDGKVDVVGYKKRMMSYKLEQRLQRGVGAGESRCESPGFFQGFYPTHSVFASTNPDIWGEENFDPNGRPYGDAFDPTRDETEELCDMHGLRIEGEWSEEDEELLISDILDEEYQKEEFLKELQKNAKKQKGRRRYPVMSVVKTYL